MSINKLIGEKLIAVMSSKNITVSALASKTGLAHGTISKIRNGKNHYTWQLELICEALSIPSEILLNKQITPQHAEAITSIIEIKNLKIINLLTKHIKELKNLNYNTK